ncbi:unnamed protein product [Paramecium sonneborni]|uniref:Uncharacterized protein n=1 Tax=Paramecium sonneborni TaxID=65129 RepID=A0A8S1QX53_9CILI|nr:unnamed protein product [Paramecium sonneborni]
MDSTAFLCVKMEYFKKQQLMMIVHVMFKEVQYFQEPMEITFGWFFQKRFMLKYMDLTGILVEILKFYREINIRILFTIQEWQRQQLIECTIKLNQVWQVMHQRIQLEHHRLINVVISSKKIINQITILAASSEITNQQIEQDNEDGIVTQQSYQILDEQRVTAPRQNYQDQKFQIASFLLRQLRFLDESQRFYDEFGQVCVCKFQPDYIYTDIPRQVEKSEIITTKGIIMRVYEQSYVFISLTQQDLGFFQKSHQDSLARLIIGQLDNSTKEILNYSGSVYDVERDMVVENEFEPGFYLLNVEVDWSQNYNRYLAVSCYVSKSVQFSELQFESGQRKQIIDNIFKSICQMHQIKIKMLNNNTDDKQIIYSKPFHNPFVLNIQNIYTASDTLKNKFFNTFNQINKSVMKIQKDNKKFMIHTLTEIKYVSESFFIYFKGNYEIKSNFEIQN